MKFISFYILMFLSHQIIYGQNHDFIWLFGYDSNPGNTSYGGTIMDFNNIPPNIYYQYTDMNFLSTDASVCDNNGSLQFYTNGIYIANKEHEIMENGQWLNPGPYANESAESGYNLGQGALILLAPNSQQRYYILHAPLEYPTIEVDWHCSNLYYTLINMFYNDGLGKVIEKNKAILTDTLSLGKLTGVRHANGRDWWIIFHEYATSNYYRILVTPEGIENLGKASEGVALPKEGLGQAVFSPDGSKFVRNNLIGGWDGNDYLDIYDFDRCTGLLSNHVQLQYGNNALSGGVAISPNSRYLYVSHYQWVYQFDLWSDDIPASKKVAATYDGFLDGGLPTTFYLAQLAPDGKIYINMPNGVSQLHVIHQPDLPCPDCNIEQHGIPLPTLNAFSMPNFPNYRLGPLDGSPCDTLGMDNHPVAKFRYDQDTLDYLQIAFTDLSYYEPAEWLWDFGDGSASQDTSPVHTFMNDGAYEVCLTVSNVNGSNTFCRTLQLGTVATGEAAPEVAVTVFPNPCQEGTNVILSDYLPKNASITLYDATGRPALRQPLLTGWNSLDLSHTPPGLYFYEIMEEGKRLKSGKLVRGE